MSRRPERTGPANEGAVGSGRSLSSVLHAGLMRPTETVVSTQGVPIAASAPGANVERDANDEREARWRAGERRADRANAVLEDYGYEPDEFWDEEAIPARRLAQTRGLNTLYRRVFNELVGDKTRMVVVSRLTADYWERRNERDRIAEAEEEEEDEHGAEEDVE